MSTSLMYHAFGLRGYQYVKSSFAGARVTLYVRSTRDQLRCSDCGGDNFWSQGSVTRTFRTVPIGSKRSCPFSVLGFSLRSEGCRISAAHCEL